MWSIRLMCLLFLNQWYKAFKLYRIRKFIYGDHRDSARYCTVAIWTLVFLEFGLVCSAQNNTTPQPAPLSNSDSAEIKNLNIKPFVLDKKIHLNMSWEISNTPKNYKIIIKPWHQIDHCDEATLSEYPITDVNAPYFLIESQRGVHLDCPYEINIITNTENATINYIKNYTVPDCVENICSCKLMHRLPTPELKFNSLNSNYEITLFINAETEWLQQFRLSEVIFLFINMDQEKNNKQLRWNITNTDANIAKEFKVDKSNLYFESSYKLLATVFDNRGCEIAVKDLYVTTLSPQQRWVFTILLPAILIIIFLACSLGFMKHKQCCCYICKLFMLNKLCPPQAHVRQIYRPANSEMRGESYLAVPMEFNNLYIEKEILDEISKGKADKYEISHARLRIEQKIGGGAFGQVFLATAIAIPGMPEYSPVAVKTLNKRATREESEEFLKEIEMLKQIGYHRNIVKLLGCCTIKEPFSMVMEYIPHGDLLKYLRALRTQYEKQHNTFQFTLNQHSNTSEQSQKASDSSYVLPASLPSNRLPSVTETEYTTLSSEGVPLTPRTPQQISPLLLNCELDPKELQNFALQIAQGMEYLESLQIVHRDLAARNVLIDVNKTLKISDFGLSRRGVYVNLKHNTVPLRWLSVEAIRDNLYTNKSDVWAYAIVLWEMGTLGLFLKCYLAEGSLEFDLFGFVGGFPYPTVNNHEILEFLLQGKRLDRPENCTEELYKLMVQCWDGSVDQRPTFKEAVQCLEEICNRRRVYVDFSQINPSYMYPPTEEQTVTLIKTENNLRTIEIILTDV